jgi:outer membrane protein insertion porin family
VATVEVEGVETIARPLPAPRTVAGAPLNYEAIEEDRQALRDALGDMGYADAEVGADVRIEDAGTAERAADVAFEVQTHGQIRVGRIIVQNNFDTRAEVITRELPFRSGDAFDPHRLLQGQGRVYQLGLFRSVTVRAAEEQREPGVRDVIVRVAEKSPGTFQWGLGYNTRDGFRGVGQVGYHNLKGLGRSVALRGQIDVEVGDAEPSQYLSDLTYRHPHLLDTLWSGSLKLLAQRSEREIDDFKLQRIAFIPGLERSLAAGVIAGIAWQIDETEIFDLASEIIAEGTHGCSDCKGMFDDEGSFFSMSFDPFIVRNALDDEFRPTRGTFESLRLRFAPAGLATDVPLVKIVGQHSHYVPIGEYLTFIYAVRCGWARALDSDDQVPIQERFFLGGRTTVRGFSENSLGPEARGQATEADPNPRTPPLGGDVFVNINGEVHFPILYGVQGAVFFDGGGVYLQTYNARSERFREAAGIGLRYMTPVGPLSLDYGFKLDRRGSESLGEIHFSVGRVF